MDFIGLKAWALRSFSLTKFNKIVQVNIVVSNYYLNMIKINNSKEKEKKTTKK